MNPRDVLLTTEKLDVRIGGIQVCNNLDLAIHEQNCWGILGANGVGKTTLLHTLAGLKSVHSGRILLGDTTLSQLPRKPLARKLGVLFQGEQSGFPATLLETVLGGRHPHLGRLGWETPNDLELAMHALQQVGLKGMEGRPIATLSGGEQRRMDIATLLLQMPGIALLDEPSNHLDPGQQIGMLEILHTEFTQPGRCAVMVLHDINLALRFCDHLLLLKGNGDWLAGATDMIATEDNLSRLYDYPMRRIEDGSGYCVLPD